MRKFLLVFCFIGLVSGPFLKGMESDSDDGVISVPVRRSGPRREIVPRGDRATQEQPSEGSWEDVDITPKEKILCIPVSKKTKDGCAAWGCCSPGFYLLSGLVFSGALGGVGYWAGKERVDRLAADQNLVNAVAQQETSARAVELTCLVGNERVVDSWGNVTLWGKGFEDCKLLGEAARGDEAGELVSMAIFPGGDFPEESDEAVFLEMGEGLPDESFESDCIAVHNEELGTYGRDCLVDDGQGGRIRKIEILARRVDDDYSPCNEEGETGNYPLVIYEDICTSCVRIQYKTNCRAWGMPYFCHCSFDKEFINTCLAEQTMEAMVCIAEGESRYRVWDDIIDEWNRQYGCRGASGRRHARDCECRSNDFCDQDDY